MSLNVVPLAPRPNENLVQMLEELLQDAKAGDVVNLAYAAVKPDGSTRDGFSAGPYASALLGGVSFLAWRLASTCVLAGSEQ